MYRYSLRFGFIDKFIIARSVGKRCAASLISLFVLLIGRAFAHLRFPFCYWSAETVLSCELLARFSSHVTCVGAPSYTLVHLRVSCVCSSRSCSSSRTQEPKVLRKYCFVPIPIRVREPVNFSRIMRHFSIYLSVCVATFYVITAEEQQKRAPSGFTGVRGKKSIPNAAYTETTETADGGVGNDLNDVVADVTYVEKRAPSGFLGMRGKKPFDRWIREDSGELYKRTPSGFMGMRGKKELNYDNYYDKRVPSGFFGMRGKKTYDGDLYLHEKRTPSGFFGMRGKKDYDDEMDDMKRALPENRFFGMRGKKQPNRSSFFGMRGKKYPYEFRGKFVGVRGKKSLGEISSPVYLSSSSNVYDGDFLRSDDDLDLDQLMRLLAENEMTDDFQTQKADGYIAQQQI